MIEACFAKASGFLWYKTNSFERLHLISSPTVQAARMKLAAFLLLLAGWLIILVALAILNAAVPRAIFTIAGMAVEILGLVLALRSHAALPEEKP
jgi:hypothetical protein